MAAGDPSRGDVAIERRHGALIAVAAMTVILAVMAAGGSVTWPTAFLSVGALAVLMTIYLVAASQSDRWAGQGRSARASEGAAVSARQRGGEDEAFARLILEALPDPVLLVREGGRVDAANAAAQQVFHPARGDYLLSSVVREPQFLDAVERALRNAESSDVEYRETTPKERFLRALVRPFHGVADASPMALVVIRDESAVKRAELARADFLANASHELRTPLASLMGYIETLSGHARNDAEARDRFLAIMSGQAHRMRSLIDDLLSLSRIEQTEHMAPTDIVDIAKLAGDVVDAMSPLVEERRVSIELVRESLSARVIGDREEMTQAIQNLIENAIKYSDDPGFVSVEIGQSASAAQAEFAATLLSPDAGRMSLLSVPSGAPVPQIWLRVSDRGPGIERRHLPRLSERFFRGDSDQAVTHAGTGLGLAIVKHILTRHRGGLTVESAQGVGSRFTIFLPQSPEAETDSKAEAPEAAEGDRTRL